MDSDPNIDDSRITLLSHRSGANVLSMMRPDGGEAYPVVRRRHRRSPWTPAPANPCIDCRIGRGSVLIDRSLLSWTTDHTLPSTNNNVPAPFLIRLGRTAGGPTRVLSPTHYTGEVFCWAPHSSRIAYSRFIGAKPGNDSRARPERSEHSNRRGKGRRNARGSCPGEGRPLACVRLVAGRAESTLTLFAIEFAGFRTIGPDHVRPVQGARAEGEIRETAARRGLRQWDGD